METAAIVALAVTGYGLVFAFIFAALRVSALAEATEDLANQRANGDCFPFVAIEAERSLHDGEISR